LAMPSKAHQRSILYNMREMQDASRRRARSALCTPMKERRTTWRKLRLDVAVHLKKNSEEPLSPSFVFGAFRARSGYLDLSGASNTAFSQSVGLECGCSLAQTFSIIAPLNPRWKV
jgi:hypothetical protein